MTIRLPRELRRRFEMELVRAGRNEIGGILMGRDLGGGTFRIEDLHIQRNRGSFAYFLRQVETFLAPLERFFHRTGHRYTEYNYLGEWHSHPSFLLQPSATDQASMRSLVEDPEVGATFAVLLIVKLNKDGHLMARAFVFMPIQPHFEVALHLEEHEETPHFHG